MLSTSSLSSEPSTSAVSDDAPVSNVIISDVNAYMFDIFGYFVNDGSALESRVILHHYVALIHALKYFNRR